MWGERGFHAWQQRRIEKVDLEKKYAQALRRRNEIALKVKLVQKMMDRDLLEQLAWGLFRFVPQHKKVILFKDKI